MSNPVTTLPEQFKGPFVGYDMGKIFIDTPCGGSTVLDIRGWGWLTGKGGGLAMPEADAEEVQTQFERWVVAALNHYEGLNTLEDKKQLEINRLRKVLHGIADSRPDQYMDIEKTPELTNWICDVCEKSRTDAYPDHD